MWTIGPQEVRFLPRDRGVIPLPGTFLEPREDHQQLIHDVMQAIFDKARLSWSGPA